MIYQPCGLWIYKLILSIITCSSYWCIAVFLINSYLISIVKIFKIVGTANMKTSNRIWSKNFGTCVYMTLRCQTGRGQRKSLRCKHFSNKMELRMCELAAKTTRLKVFIISVSTFNSLWIFKSINKSGRRVIYTTIFLHTCTTATTKIIIIINK